MSKIRHFAAAAVATIALFLVGSDIGPPQAHAAPAPTAVIANPTASAAAPAPATANGPVTPRIIVIDRNFILQRSTAGQDMLTQAQNLSKQADTQFKTEETQLANEATQLQQQLAILSPDVRDQKEKDFTNKQQAFQTRVAQRQAEIQAGFNKAAHQVEVALEPILKVIMTERGANMVLDRTSVILSTVDIDVTPIAVQRLDKALPHVKVELTAVPATAVAGAPKPPAAPSIVPAAAPPAPARK